MSKLGTFIKGTGSYEVKEMTSQDAVLKDLDVGTKYLECTSSGTIAIPSKQAYGTWEFDYYHLSNSSSVICFINQDKNDLSNGYVLIISSSEAFLLRRYINGSDFTLFTAGNNYLQDENIWYKIKITRTKEGEFYVYIKGGDFGSDSWILVDVTGGSGTNPATDNTYAESKYMVLDLDAGEKLANLKVYNDVKQ